MARQQTRRKLFAITLTALGLLAALVVGLVGPTADAVPTVESLFSATSVPAVPSVDNDSGSVELGVKFTPAVSGTVTGVKFYKGPGNTGTHTGALWSSAGKLLASGTFTQETATGWQLLTFSTPVPVRSGTTYVGSYHAPHGRYADDQGYFTQVVKAGDLTAPRNAGVFAYGSRTAFPRSVWHASNYWVDIAFMAGAVPPPTTTTQPVTTTVPTTSPSTTTQPPPTSGTWPTADDTGATGTLADVTPPSGELILGDDGQVLQNTRVHGTVTVTACNVTIRNVEVDAGEPFTGDNTPDLFAIWLQESASCGVTIDRVSTIASSAPNVYVTTSIRVARGGPVTITNSKMIGAQLGILGVSSGMVRGNYIELGKNMRGDHNDAIQGDGSSNLTIDHNTLLNPNDQTSALALYTEYGNNTNDMVSGNLFAGGGYACYCGDGMTDNDGHPARASNVSFVDNVFWRRYFPDVGAFGPGRAYNPAGGGRWAGNVFMDADGTLTSQAVPQPSLDGQ